MSAVTANLRMQLDDDYQSQPAGPLGQRVVLMWQKYRNPLQRSAADWQPSISAALNDIRRDCAKDGWDGQGSFAVS